MMQANGELSARTISEVRRQADILIAETRHRVIGAMAVIALCGLFLQSWLVLPFLLTSALAERLLLLALRRFVHRPSRRDYGQFALFSVLSGLSYSVPVALVWADDGRAQLFLGACAFFGALMHVSLIRAAHLPVGGLCLLANLLPVLLANSLMWVDLGDLPLLAFSTVAVLGLALFAWGTMMANNAMQLRIVEALARAEAASAAKSRFLATMSHELRTPLNGIIGISEALHHDQADPEIRARIDVLRRSAASLRGIVDDVLDLTRITAGTTDLTLAPGDPAAEVRNVAASFGPEFAAKGLSFAVVIAPDVPQTARISTVRLRQALTNLLSNALRYTDEGGITVELATGQPGSLALSVTDTGPGIAKADRDRVMDPFVQLNTSIAGHRGGVGLGLAISRRLAELMGGGLEVEDGPLRGSRLRLTFAAPPCAPPPPEPTPAALAGPLHLLVVDDMSSNRLIARLFLERDGHRVTEAANWHETLAALRSDPPDALLLDMRLPEIDGPAIFARIRASDTVWRNVPVVAMTADAMPEDRARILSFGFDGYVAKPVDMTQLRREIGRAVAEGQANRSWHSSSASISTSTSAVVL